MHIALRTAIGAVGGALVGFAIYKFIGCRTGTCPLTGNPYIAVALWGFMGTLIAVGR